jgi:hypothetical protein
LFQDFAEVICNDPRHYWWTQLALLYSLGWNIYMSVEGRPLQINSGEKQLLILLVGTKNEIPNLWAYFLLDQILPVSFTQNLFLVAILLKPKVKRIGHWQYSGRLLHVVIVVAYLGSLLAAPLSVGKSFFFPVIFAARFLLFAPFALSRPYIARNLTNGSGAVDMGGYRAALVTLCIGGFGLQVVQAARLLPMIIPVAALNDNAAVSALGHDFLLGIFSLIVFNIA